MAISTETGDIIWEVNLNYVTASPALDDNGNIIIGEGNNLTKISKDGEIIWKYKLRDGVSAKPAIDGNGNIYLSNHDEYIYCINKDGNLVWERYMGVDMSASIVIDCKGNLYVGGYERKIGESRFFKLNYEGKLLWDVNIGKNALPSFAAIDYDNRRIYFLTSTVSRDNTDSSYFYGLNLDGEEEFKVKVENKYVQGSPCIDSNGNVYIGYEKTYKRNIDGVLAVFNHNGELINEFKSDGDIIGPATLDDGCLYFGDTLGNLYKIK